MKTITDLTPQKKDKKRLNVYLDGEYYCAVERITLLTNNLHIGSQISEEDLFRILEESEYTSAFEKASKYLAGGNRTKVQTISYLKGKSYENRVIAKVILKLEEYGYLDDEVFAQSFVELKKKSRGKKRLELELRLKGVDEKLAEKVVDSIEDEDESAFLVVKKYLKSKPFDFENKAKCFRYLLSKGFTYDSAQSAVERLERELKQ